MPIEPGASPNPLRPRLRGRPLGSTPWSRPVASTTQSPNTLMRRPTSPPGLPFRSDVETLKNGLTFTLTTSLGDIDLFGETVGGGTYEMLASEGIEIEVLGERRLCIGLEDSIRAKRVAGRPKDLEAIAELETLLELARRVAHAHVGLLCAPVDEQGRPAMGLRGLDGIQELPLGAGGVTPAVWLAVFRR